MLSKKLLILVCSTTICITNFFFFFFENLQIGNLNLSFPYKGDHCSPTKPQDS